MTNPILSDDLLIADALHVATWTVATNGPTLDTWANGGEYRQAILAVKCNMGASATATIIIQESDDGSSWSAVDGATFNLTNANADDTPLIANVRAVGLKRYLRARISAFANSPAGAAFWILGDSRKKPASQVETIMFEV